MVAARTEPLLCATHWPPVLYPVGPETALKAGGLVTGIFQQSEASERGCSEVQRAPDLGLKPKAATFQKLLPWLLSCHLSWMPTPCPLCALLVPALPVRSQSFRRPQGTWH